MQKQLLLKYTYYDFCANIIFYNIHGDHNDKTVKFFVLSIEDCGYKWCVYREMVCNNNIFVFNVNCVDVSL